MALSYTIVCDHCSCLSHTNGQSEKTAKIDAVKYASFFEVKGEMLCMNCAKAKKAAKVKTFEIKVPFKGYRVLSVTAISKAEAKRLIDDYMQDTQSIETRNPEIFEQLDDITWTGKAQ